MTSNEFTPEKALGNLNEVEKKHAPIALYWIGNSSLFKSPPKVSIVGSRKVSADGLKRTKKITKLLIQKNITIVSGLAEGVDTIAHETAIHFGGKTIAVIGTPLNKSYPASNKELQIEISKEHLLVSQFIIGTPGGRKCFPMRNRTMALISDATIIVEAQDGSGTLHQGWETLRLGRPLFIMESSTKDDSLSWPQEFLAYGAHILKNDSFDELVEMLPQLDREETSNISI